MMKRIKKVLVAVMSAMIFLLSLTVIGTVNVYAEERIDPATANRETVQKCLDKAKNGALTVRFPAGTYKIDGTLTVYSNTTLIFDAGARITRTDPTKAIFITDPTNTAGGYSKASNITIKGGDWDGEGKGDSSTGSAMMIFYHSKNIKLENCNIHNYSARHAVIFGGVSDIKVSGCTFKDAKGNSDSKHEALHIDGVTTDGQSEKNAVPLDGTVSKNISVTGCTFANVPSGVGNHYASGARGSTFKVNSNTFSNIKYDAVNTYGYDGVDVSGNTASNVGTFAWLYSSSGSVNNNTASCANRGLSSVSDMHGIYIYNDARFDIKNNKITGALASGIMIDRASAGSVSGNTVSSPSGYGITLNNGAKVSDISGNNISGAVNGINITSSEGGTVSGNTVDKSSQCGIAVNTGGTATVSGNTITNSSKHGVNVSENSAAVIAENSIKSSGSNGISINGAKGNIKGNTISGVGDSSIGLYGGSSSDYIDDNKAEGKSAAAIYIKESTVGRVSGNTAYSSGKYAIGVSLSTVTELINNTIENSPSYGIFYDASSGRIGGNTIKSSADHSLHITNGSNVTVSGNTITSSKRNAVNFNGASGDVSGNVITSASGVGIKIYQSSNVSVKGNTVTKSGDYGISIDASTNAEVTGNTVTGSSRDDISAVNNSTGSASDNKITSSKTARTYDETKFKLSNNSDGVSIKPTEAPKPTKPSTDPTTSPSVKPTKPSGGNVSTTGDKNNETSSGDNKTEEDENNTTEDDGNNSGTEETRENGETLETDQTGETEAGGDSTENQTDREEPNETLTDSENGTTDGAADGTTKDGNEVSGNEKETYGAADEPSKGGKTGKYILIIVGACVILVGVAAGAAVIIKRKKR